MPQSSKPDRLANALRPIAEIIAKLLDRYSERLTTADKLHRGPREGER